MSKRRVYITVLAIFIVAFLAGNLDYPQLLKIPFFPDIPFKLGLDLQGGTHLIYEADLSNIDEKDKGQKMEVLRDVIEKRVNWYGVAEPVIQIQGENRLVVELAGVKDIGEAIKMIGETPYLEFREVLSEEEKQEAMKDISDEQISEAIESFKQQTGQEISREELLQALTSGLFKPTELTGEYLKEAEVSFNQTTYQPQISLKFKEEGVKLFEEITARNIGKPLAIFLDQKSIIDTDGDGEITDNDLYAPIVQEKIPRGEAVITGEMDIVRAKEIVKRLNWGALPVKIGEPISQQSVGPTLGNISLEKSLRAGIFGLIGVILFLIIFYRLPGLLASLALAIYVALMLALFKIIPVTLTLAGIGGFILSIGMAIDANILIFSRFREELKEGKSFLMAVEEGFKRAWPSIRDGNLTTLIVALILFSFGTSFVKGFALTLTIGILMSMVSAIIITKNFLKCFVATRLERVKFLWQ
ncbi:Protein translocase subunit SecDF [subsurface metagenome]